MSQEQRIAVYSISDLKNITDDAIPPYLRHKKRFTQNHMIADVRLTLGYFAVAIAAVTFYFDYTSTWEQTKAWTLWAVMAYFAINSILTLWIWGVEKGKIFTGSRDDLLISVASHVSKYDPIYHLKVRYSNSSNKTDPRGTLLEIKTPFTRWFTADGKFLTDNFHSWLDSAAPILKRDKEGVSK